MLRKQKMKSKTPIQSSNDSLKYSIPAAAFAALAIVVINRLLEVPFTVEESAAVTWGLTVAFNYAIAYAYKRFSL